jgi:biotin carboxylase
VTLLVLNRRPLVESIPGWLSDIDPSVVLLTAASAVRPGTLDRVADRYREVVLVDDYAGESVETLALELARRHRVTRVLSTAEVDVLRAARIRERLGLPGQDVRSATVYRDKFRMKSVAAAAGLPVAGMRRIDAPRDLADFADSCGFPIVVKPVDGGGSVGVAVLSDATALHEWIASVGTSEPHGLLAETWVSGEQVVVDGLMAGGEIVQCWALRMRHPYLTTVAEARACVGWMLPRGDALGERARDFAARVVRALPGPAEVTAFHAELFHTADDRLVLCEIACRPGGTCHVPAFELAFGVNLYAASLRGQAGRRDPVSERADDPRMLTGWAQFPPRAGRLLAVPAACPLPGVHAYSHTAAVGTEYHGARSVADNIARVLVAGPAGTDLAGRLAEVEAWWAANCRWAPENPAGDVALSAARDER